MTCAYTLHYPSLLEPEADGEALGEGPDVVPPPGGDVQRVAGVQDALGVGRLGKARELGQIRVFYVDPAHVRDHRLAE